MFRTKKLNEIFGRLFGFVLIYRAAISTRSSISPSPLRRTGKATASSRASAYSLVSYLLWVFGPT